MTQSKRLYDNAGRWVALDERHRIGQDGTGDPKRTWVFRFCDEFVDAYATKREATAEALKWEMARVSRLTP